MIASMARATASSRSCADICNGWLTSICGTLRRTAPCPAPRLTDVRGGAAPQPANKATPAKAAPSPHRCSNWRRLGAAACSAAAGARAKGWQGAQNGLPRLAGMVCRGFFIKAARSNDAINYVINQSCNQSSKQTNKSGLRRYTNPTRTCSR